MLYDPKWEKQAETKPHVRVLIEARKLIERKKDWFGASDNAINTQGKCAFQAVRHISKDQIGNDACAALNNVVGGDMFSWNDNHTHAEVLAAFDRAIAAA